MAGLYLLVCQSSPAFLCNMSFSIIAFVWSSRICTFSSLKILNTDFSDIITEELGLELLVCSGQKLHQLVLLNIQHVKHALPVFVTM